MLRTATVLQLFTNLKLRSESKEDCMEKVNEMMCSLEGGWGLLQRVNLGAREQRAGGPGPR